MVEFLIQRTDGMWFELPETDWERLYLPRSVPAEHIQGGDVPAIRVLGCEVTFSFEEPGIQVSFMTGDPSPEEASRVVHEVLENITEATGQKGKVIQIA